MKFLFALPFIILSVVPSCNGDDDTLPFSDCGPFIEIVGSIDGLDSGDGFAISEVSVEDLCLSIKVSATGCNPEEWTAELVTDGSVAESTPTQTIARFTFDNHLPEDAITCLALAFKTFTFDLSPYLAAGALPSNLTLMGPADSSRIVMFVE